MNITSGMTFTQVKDIILGGTLTWTIPAGTFWVWVDAYAGGGGGGGSDNSAQTQGNGGNAGQIIIRRRLPAIPGDVWTAVIGAAGVGGSGGVTGGNGGDTTISSAALATADSNAGLILRCYGGLGGQISNAGWNGVPQPFGTKTNFTDVYYPMPDTPGGMIIPGAIGGTATATSFAAYQNPQGNAMNSGLTADSGNTSSSTTHFGTPAQMSGQSGLLGIGGRNSYYGDITTSTCGRGYGGAGAGANKGANGSPTAALATDYACGGGGAYASSGTANGGNGAPGFLRYYY